MPHDRHRRDIVSFVRRGERLVPRLQRAWEEMAPALLLDVPRAASSTSVDPHYRFDRAEVFGERRTGRLVLEIGSGVGESLVASAADHGEDDFLGFEVWAVGIAQTFALARRNEVANIRLAQVDAAKALSMFDDASIDEVRVYFPDPWHKTKHRKRRLLSARFAPLLRRVIVPGGLIRMATDWQDYALEMRKVFDAAEGFERAFDEDWAERFEGRPVTKFERKGITVGRPIRDLVYRAT